MLSVLFIYVQATISLLVIFLFYPKPYPKISYFVKSVQI